MREIGTPQTVTQSGRFGTVIASSNSAALLDARGVHGLTAYSGAAESASARGANRV